MRILVVIFVLMGAVSAVQAQEPIPLSQVLRLAREASPELAAARAAARGAEGQAHQAGAFPNPALAMGRERTASSRQWSLQIEQPLDLTGTRGAARTAAERRAAAARATVDRVEQIVAGRATRLFVRLVTARRRLGLAARLRDLADSAAAIAAKRFDLGDGSGYDRRRLALEAARYEAAVAGFRFEADSMALELTAMLGSSAPTGPLVISDTVPVAGDLPPLDSLVAWSRRRGDVRAAELSVDAAESDRTVRARERIPIPTLAAGYLEQNNAGTSGSSSGWIGGLTIPVPLFNRRAGALLASQASVELARAEHAGLVRDAATEVRRLHAGFLASRAQRASLARRLGGEADAALNAVAVSFAEGELPLVQWLDAVRAYSEAAGALLLLDADLAIRRADLATAAGIPADLVPGATP